MRAHGWDCSTPGPPSGPWSRAEKGQVTCPWRLQKTHQKTSGTQRQAYLPQGQVRGRSGNDAGSYRKRVYKCGIIEELKKRRTSQGAGRGRSVDPAFRRNSLILL